MQKSGNPIIKPETIRAIDYLCIVIPFESCYIFLQSCVIYYHIKHVLKEVGLSFKMEFEVPTSNV